MAYEILPAGKMADSPVPPYKVLTTPPEAVQLQEPAYFPDILPIYPAKMNPYFWDPVGDGSQIPNPPDPPPPENMAAFKVRANVDEPFRQVSGNEPDVIPMTGPQYARATGVVQAPTHPAEQPAEHEQRHEQRPEQQGQPPAEPHREA